MYIGQKLTVWSEQKGPDDVWLTASGEQNVATGRS